VSRFTHADRVRRRVDVFDDSSPYRHGAIVNRYAKRSFLGWWDNELYAVLWDDGTYEEGFFPHGLSPSAGESTLVTQDARATSGEHNPTPKAPV
jgi:hypothetical protein